MSDEVNAPYWEGAAEGRLVVQRCTECGTLRHYPRVLCDQCWSFGVEPADGGERGEVHSWTVAHHRFDPDLPAEPPYTLVTVTMSSGVRVLGLYRDEPSPSVGQHVALAFEPVPGRDRPVPVFTPLTS